MNEALHALVLAGGSGTRFWPLSRRTRPKQLLQLVPDAEGRTLLGLTLARVAPLVADRVLVVAPGHHADAIRAVANLAADALLVEPVAANTAPAILYGTLAAAARQPDAIVAVLPSDHAIEPADAFRAALAHAAELATRRDAIVTFGIPPATPNTGFGYLERGAPVEGGAYTVAAFREKPDAATAERYVAAGCFYWNSGMFVFPAERLLAAYRRHYPAAAAAMAALRPSLAHGTGTPALVADLYASVEATSVDYAIMEKEPGLLVVPATFGWNDVGAPSALAELWPTDGAGNCVVRATLADVEARGNVVITRDAGKVVALLGVSGLVVIDTPDALLVCPADRDQEIRRVVELLRARGLEEKL